MYSKQAYPSFTLNHGIIQDGFEGYHHPSQAFFSPAVRTDSGALGEHQAQVMDWDHATQLEPPGHLNFCAPPSHQLNIETPCVVESRNIEESEDSDGSVEKSHLIPQDYPYDWIPDFWPESPNFSSQTQQNANIPGSEVYLTPPNQSPNMPVETIVANLGSSLCSSAPTEEVAKESNSPASSTVTSLGAQEKILSEDREDMLKMSSKMEMEQFARDLRAKRLSLGYTQADVCHAVEVLYGKMFSQGTIYKFESMKLSYKTMCQIKPYLHRWLEDAKNNEHLQEKTRSEMEMEQYARDLKQKRLDMGYTQADVCDAVEVLYGKTFSQATICKFESAKLSYKNMCQIKPYLHRWLEVAENDFQEMINREHVQEQALAQSQKRKHRIGINPITKDSLEVYFRNNPEPVSQELEQIAQDLHLEKEVVHVWFYNRRQKEKTPVVKELGNKGYEPQHKVPHVGVLPFPGDMSGSPPM